VSDEKKEAAAGAAAKKKTKGLVGKLVVPLGLVVAGVAAAQFLLPGKAGAHGDGHEAAAPPEHGAPPASESDPHAKTSPTGAVKKITYLLPNVLVNLANTGAKRFLKMSIALDCELPDVGSDDEARAKLDALKSQFHDRVIEMLSARTIESLEGRESKVALKNDILEELDPILKAATGGRLAKLYYQEFVIQ